MSKRAGRPQGSPLLMAGIGLAIASIFSCSEGSNGNISTCGGKEYDTTVYSCVSGELVGSCRGQPYYPEYEYCDNGEIKDGAEISSSSLARSSSSNGGSQGSSGSVTYEGKTYRTVKIGTQIWFAENLNYNVSGSKCYGEGGGVITSWDENYNPITTTLSPSEVQANCTKYGRLYDWATATVLTSICNSISCKDRIQPKHQGICPNGWHIPSNSEWDELFYYVDNENGWRNECTETDCRGCPIEGCSGNPCVEYQTACPASRYLKATLGWNAERNGTDKYDFSALPGGRGDSDGSFFNAGSHGYWWSASENHDDDAYIRDMYYNLEDAYRGSFDKSYLLSVRCLQD